MYSGAERMIRDLSSDELNRCAEWLAQALEAEEDGARRELRGDVLAEERRQALEREYLLGVERGRRSAMQVETALAAQRAREAEEQAARKAEADRLEAQREIREMQQLWLSMNGGKNKAAKETESALPENAGAVTPAHAGESAGPSPAMDEISEFFRRDSRRYDGGFVRY